MQKWQILEFDGKPFYAFVPFGVEPLKDSAFAEEEVILASEQVGLKKEDTGKFRIKEDVEMASDLEFQEEEEEYEEKGPSSPISLESNSLGKMAEGDIDNGNYSEVKDERNEAGVENLDVNMELLEHVDTSEEELEEDPSKAEAAESMMRSEEHPFKCKACSIVFSTDLAFRKHVAWTHQNHLYVKSQDNYNCSLCNYSSVHKNLFASHIEKNHQAFASKKTNRFPCTSCNFVCRSKHSLQSHFTRKHTDLFEYECKICPKKFKVKGDLTNHIRFHHREKPVSCDLCGKLCSNSGSLYVHQKWAHFKPQFECSICKRRMVSQENLDQHIILQHRDPKKFVCEQCGKTFTKNDSFKRHLAVHTGQKPHACIVCQKHFARRSQLRQHILIHTGQKPFVCDICGKSFSQKPGLICHRKTHPGTHPPLPKMPISGIVKEFTDKCVKGEINIQE